MALTYEPIATTTLGTAASSITFSSISSAYTDLRLVLVLQGTAASGCYIRFNNVSTGTVYSGTYLQGNGSAASSFRYSPANQVEIQTNGVSTSNWVFSTLDIFSYAGSTNKTVLSTDSSDLNGSGYVSRIVSLWRDTSAINRIDIGLFSGNLNTGTTATLYGILKA